MHSETVILQGTVQSMRDMGLPTPQLVLVLGSGLRDFAQQLSAARAVDYSQIPDWPSPKAEGHGGQLVVGELSGVVVACLTGRVHLYEGWQPHQVVRALRCLRLLGAEKFLLTNAAGGIADGMQAGDLMLIQDQLNLTGQSALVGPQEDLLGTRFPDQSQIYDAELRKVLLGCDASLCQGIYAGLLGPGYETPAEIQMLKTMGASAVGMSTVLEASALNAMGAKVVGLSLISNMAAGIADTSAGPVPLNHGEVLAAGQAAASRMTRLLTQFCQACRD